MESTSASSDGRVVHQHNAAFWDASAARGGVWSTPVGADEVSAARSGTWAVKLTPHRCVPQDWFPAMDGLSVLGLAEARSTSMITPADR